MFDSNIKNNRFVIYITLVAGLALFAMFFGASNLIFPLYLGANSWQYLTATIAGFLIGGVAIPLLGLIASSMYNGDYWAFFNRLGKIPAVFLISFLMLIIGPLGAMPRIEILVLSTLKPFIPKVIDNNYTFSFIFCSLIFILNYKKNKVVDILGLILSPIKIFTALVLIIVGIFPWAPQTLTSSSIEATDVLKISLNQGYLTMDLLATCFFSVIIFQFVNRHKEKLESANTTPTRVMINSSIIAGCIISILYLGFILLAYNHALSLQGIPPEKMVLAISLIVFGNLGSLYVCITVSLACLATVLALSDVCCDYLDRVIFKQKINRNVSLLLVVGITYFTSNLGFQKIMSYASPIFEVIYPAIITLSVINILHKTHGIKTVKIPVFLVCGICLLRLFF